LVVQKIIAVATDLNADWDIIALRHSCGAACNEAKFGYTGD
jgi:hypothetical protein